MLSKHKKDEVAILIPGEDFKARDVTWDKERHFINDF